MKKRFKNAANFWKSLSSGLKFAIVSILVAVFLFGHWAMGVPKENWSYFSVQEEDFDALTEVAYDIIETRDITKPKSEKVKDYEATVYTDGTITVSMSASGVESINMMLSEDFQIIQFERKNSTFWLIIGLVLFFLFAGMLVVTIVQKICKVVKWIYNKYKKSKP